ncbi:hypothetical protein LSPCS325_33030 [Lysinibacillus sp. CTST325]
MDRTEELLKNFGLVPEIDFVDRIRNLLKEEIENESSENNEYIKTLCIQLFALGYVDDTLLIWRAKEKDFDTHSYIDVQLLCGAGLEKTLGYLQKIDTLEAKKELSYLWKCKEDFEDFNVEEVLNFYKKYYGI